MKKTIFWQSHLLTFGIPLLLITFLIALTNSSYFLLYAKELSVAITLDLIVTLPVVYFLLIRKKKTPNFTVLSIFILGVLIAGFILPEEHQSFLELVKTIGVPIAELFLLIFIIINSPCKYLTRKNVKLFAYNQS